MKKDIQIQGLELKTSKAGKEYHSYQTNEGKMSCFEDKVNDKLKQHIGKYVNCNVEERNNFKNITEFYHAEESQPQVQTQVIAPSQPAKAEAIITNVPQEHKYRINIKQNAKGFSYYEVTVKADSIEELEKELKKVKQVAKLECDQSNALQELRDREDGSS